MKDIKQIQEYNRRKIINEFKNIDDKALEELRVKEIVIRRGVKTLEQRIAEIEAFCKNFDNQIVRGDLISCLSRLEDSLDLIKKLEAENQGLQSQQEAKIIYYESIIKELKQKLEENNVY